MYADEVETMVCGSQDWESRVVYVKRGKERKRVIVTLTILV